VIYTVPDSNCFDIQVLQIVLYYNKTLKKYATEKLKPPTPECIWSSHLEMQPSIILPSCMNYYNHLVIINTRQFEFLDSLRTDI